MGQLWQSILNAGWAWATLSWLCLGAAALVLLWALFRDRPGLWGIPRVRCPRCRYDMSGNETPGATCPECGTHTRDPKRLRKTRRRWGLALLAVPLLIGWHLASNKEDIRRHGWIAAAPTVAIMPFVEPEAWFELTRGGRHRGSPKTLAERLHRRLVTSDISMSIWLWRVSGLLDREGLTVIGIGEIAPVREGIVVDHLAREMQGFSYLTPIIDEEHPEAFADLVIGSIDPEAWIDNGGEWHGPLRRAGDRLLVRATPGVELAINELVAMMRSVANDPSKPRNARIMGCDFYVVALAHFAEADWYASAIAEAEERHRESVREAERAAALGLGGGGGGSGPWSGGTPLFDKPLPRHIVDESFRWQILQAFQLASDTRYWVDHGGDLIEARWIGDLLVVHSRYEMRDEFDACVRRIYDSGPDAVINEETPD